MLYGAAEDVPVVPTAPVAPAGAEAVAEEADTATTEPPTAPAAASSLGSPETQERIARFNERNTRRRRSPWQVIEDAPLLLRRLWADLRRGDTQVFSELIRRGVQLQLFVVALYILSPVSKCGAAAGGRSFAPNRSRYFEFVQPPASSSLHLCSRPFTTLWTP